MRPSRAISRTSEDSELDRLKARLLRQTLDEVAMIDADGFIRRAANESAALAWDTRVPLLTFPSLFEERARTALARARHQVSVRRRSLKLLSA